MIYLALIIWRVGLFLLAYISQNIPFSPRFPYSDIYLIPSGLPKWVWGFANFDGVHYLGIAKSGYFAQYTQAFFPLYSILIKIVAFVSGDEFFILSGLFISYVSFVGVFIIFTKLLRLDYEKKHINKILLILLFFPTSFFFGALYTESFFLFLVLLSFWFARKKKWVLSAVVASFASLTRITGVFLLIPLLWEWNIQKFQISNFKFQISLKGINIHKFTNYCKKIVLQSLKSPVLYIAPLGLISYMVYLQIKFSDWLYFWHAQSVFGAERSGSKLIFPIQVVWRYIKILTSVSMNSQSFWIAFWELGAFLFAIGLLLIAHRKRVRFSYLLFGWLVILIPSLTGTLSSMPRYILLVFPMYIVLGTIKNKYIYLSIVIIFASLLIYFTSLFNQGQWVA